MPATYQAGDTYPYATIQGAIDDVPGNLNAQGIQTINVYPKAPSNQYDENPDASTGFTNASVADHIELYAMVSNQGLRNTGIVIRTPGVDSTAFGRSTPYTEWHGFGVTIAEAILDRNKIWQWYLRNTQHVFINGCIIFDVLINAGIGQVFGVIFEHSLIIQNTAIINIGCPGGGGSPTYGLRMFGTGVSADCWAYNCTIIPNQPGTTGVRMREGANTFTVTNMIVGGTTALDYDQSLGVLARTHCISEDASVGGGVGNMANQNLTTDVMLTNHALGTENIHFLAGSVAIDAGADLSGVGVVDDIDGNARPQGPAFDIGADEALSGALELTNISVGYERMRENVIFP